MHVDWQLRQVLCACCFSIEGLSHSQLLSLHIINNVSKKENGRRAFFFIVVLNRGNIVQRRGTLVVLKKNYIIARCTVMINVLVKHRHSSGECHLLWQLSVRCICHKKLVSYNFSKSIFCYLVKVFPSNFFSLILKLKVDATGTKRDR